MDGKGGVTIYRCVSVFQNQVGNGEVSFFSFSFSVQISHKLLFVRSNSNLLSRWSPLHWSRTALVTINYPLGEAPGRTKGSLGDTRDDQGCNGWCPRGPRLHGATPRRIRGASAAPRRTKGALAKKDNIVVVIAFKLINNVLLSTCLNRRI